MTDLDPRIQTLLDKEAIREAILRYARGVDRGDVQLLSAAYHDDAVDERHEILRGEGIGASMVESMMRSMAATTHHLGTQTIVIDGDTAGAETYSIGFHRPIIDGVEQRMMTSNRYVDRLERRDGEWRITHRRLVTEMAKIMPLDGEFDTGAPYGQRDRTDISYDVLGR